MGLANTTSIPMWIIGYRSLSKCAERQPSPPPEWPAKDQGLEPRYCRCPIRCDKLHRNNSSRGDLKWHQRGPPPSCKLLEGGNTLADIWLSIRPLCRPITTLESPHLSAPLGTNSLWLVGAIEYIYLRVTWNRKWLTAVNFAYPPTGSTVLQRVNLIAARCKQSLSAGLTTDWWPMCCVSALSWVCV